MAGYYLFEADRPKIDQVGDVAFYKLNQGALVIGPALTPFLDVVNQVQTKGGSLVLDFTDVTRIDSSALGEIVRAHTKLDGALGIFGANKKVTDFFKVTKVYTVLHSHASREETLEKTPARALRGTGGTTTVTEVTTAHL